MIEGLKEFYDFKFGSRAKISEAEFPLYEVKAIAELDRLTDGRFSKLQDNECDNERIKICVCETMEQLYENQHTGNIVSENNDGYSVTYKSENKNGVYEIAKRYLSQTGILYRGF